MKYILILFLLFTISPLAFSQKKIDSTLLFLKKLNTKILAAQKLNSCVHYDFKFIESDTAGNKINTQTGSVVISKEKNDLKYIIKNKEEGSIVLYANKELLIVDNKKKNYYKLDSFDKNLATRRYQNMTGLLDEFRLNSAISFVYQDSCFYAGIITYKDKYVYAVKHIYNPRLFDMKETIFIDTSTFFILKKIYEYKANPQDYYYINILEISNVSFERASNAPFDEKIYTKGKTKLLVKSQDTSNTDTLVLGNKAPSVKGINISTNKQSEVSFLNNKPIILDFWFIDCYPCKKASEVLKKLKSKYEAKGLQIIGLNKNDSITDIHKYLKKFKNNYPNIKVSKELANNFKVDSYPTIICIDKTGNIKYVAKSLEADLEQKLESFILSEID